MITLSNTVLLQQYLDKKHEETARRITSTVLGILYNDSLYLEFYKLCNKDKYMTQD